MSDTRHNPSASPYCISQNEKYLMIFTISYKKLNGTREAVWNETAYRTEGLLVKNDLIINKDGKIVSKRKHICSKERNNLQSVNDEKIKNAKG